MRTENLAIAFVDIAGFTPRTSAQTREENVRMLKRFDGIVRPLVRAFEGRVIKTIGDAYLLAFRSPTNAVLCSMAIQDKLAESNRGLDASEHFAVRVAVNVGDVRVDRGDVFGAAVNIAARIEGKAAAGEIYFSESVYLSMTRSEVPHEEVGFAELKGVAGKVRLYRVPKASETGYAQKQGIDSTGEREALPFGGLSLDRVRERVSWTGTAQVLAPAVDTAHAIITRLPGVVAAGTQTASKGYAWWNREVRRSRAVQYGTVVVAILLVFVIIWTVKPRQRRPNPIQQINRALGF